MRNAILCSIICITFFVASCNSANTSSKDDKISNDISCDTNAIIANYLYKHNLIDSAHAFNKELDFKNLIPSIFQPMYAPYADDYDNPRMRKIQGDTMIQRYQATRTGEVWSFMMKGNELKKYIDDVTTRGMTDMQFILAYQQPRAGSSADMTLITVGAKNSGGTWSHVYAKMPVTGVYEAVLQHVMPLKEGDNPKTTLE